ncbi:hypothetical protein M404DRAFT_1006238 [Pisolithus tinctorius Marx 270]|uniref:Uncharacterized protein n=1 Tax=Pisolithus tinctorius Marx 270 TaxID=870435 RepID=A0A0C3NNI5_PISTI|nr:hypothetical protein M404DRAFT_1006238 [Pisolithus tinctorius Marx 270]
MAQHLNTTVLYRRSTTLPIVRTLFASIRDQMAINACNQSTARLLLNTSVLCIESRTFLGLLSFAVNGKTANVKSLDKILFDISGNAT